MGKPLIAFPPASFIATFLRREKRFRVQVEREGECFWVHTNNSGSMLGLLRPGSPVLISPAPGRNRRLPYTLELVMLDGFWTGVNTSVPSLLLQRAWAAGLLPRLAEYTTFRSEAVSGESRLDACLEGPQGRLWVEAKNVTLVEDGEVAYFPDASTVRGQKHLHELMTLVRQGHRAACFFLIQRPDARCFAPADFIDPQFSNLFQEALDTGVEAWAYQATLTPEGIELGKPLPVIKP